MKKLLIVAFVCAMGFVSSAADIDLGKAKIGTPAPQFADGVWTFTGGGMRLPTLWDFSQGVKIEVEFKMDAEQTNPMPRLVEGPRISLQFMAGGKGRELRVLASSNREKGKYVLIRDQRLPGDGLDWNKAVFIYSPAAKTISLQINDGKPAVKAIPFEWDLSKQYIMIGSNMLKDGHRCFKGSIRNLKITAPYSGEAK